MKFKNTYKLFFTIFILIFSILLTSCSSLGFGTTMPTLDMQSEFENDNWLIIDNILINKTDNKVFPLEPDTNATISGIDNIYYHGPYTYGIEFEESVFKLYTFLKTNYYSEESVEFVPVFYDCVFIYDYEGHEVDRIYLSESLTEEQALSLYNTRFNKTDEFSFAVDILWKDHKEDNQSTSEIEQEILKHIENIYNNSKNSIDTISGSAKTINDEVWFSVIISPKGHYNSGNPLLDGIRNSEIKGYNSNTKEIKVIFKYNKKNETIIDFDENGLYTFDSKGNFKYFDIKLKKTTLIHKFSGTVYSFEITNNYIGASYEDGEIGYSYFVYEKGKDIVADNLYSKYNYVEK